MTMGEPKPVRQRSKMSIVCLRRGVGSRKYSAFAAQRRIDIRRLFPTRRNGHDAEKHHARYNDFSQIPGNSGTLKRRNRFS